MMLARSQTWAVTALVLAPFLAAFFPFQLALRVQLLVIAAILVSVAVKHRRRLRHPRGLFPKPVSIGLALYGGAAIWGAAVGLAVGNPGRYVASQLLAMLLLPVAAVIFVADKELDSEAVASAAVAASLAALSIHGLVLLGSAMAGLRGASVLRFELRNDAAVTGAAPLLALVILASWIARRRGWKAAGLAAAIVLVIGGLSRGGWLALALGAALVLTLLAQMRLRHVMAVVGLALAAVCCVWAGAEWVARASPVVFHAQISYPPPDVDGRSGAHGNAAAGAAEAPWTALTGYEVLPSRTVEVSVEHRAPPGRTALLCLYPRAADGSELAATYVTLAGVGQQRLVSRIVKLPSGAASLRLALWRGRDEGPWEVRHVGVRALHPSAAWLRAIALRGGDLHRAVRSPTLDTTLRYRGDELRAVAAVWRTGSWCRWLIGHGLGAVFEFPNSGWDDHGRRTTLPTASYIHNFYVFLGFKLGIAGIAGLAGLLMLTGWTWAKVLRGGGSGRRPWFLAAAAAAWTSYLLWSLTSPEIYDFRVAPLWGAVIAASAHEARSTASDPADDASG